MQLVGRVDQVIIGALKFFTDNSDVFTGINILTVPVGGYVLYTLQRFISLVMVVTSIMQVQSVQDLAV